MGQNKQDDIQGMISRGRDYPTQSQYLQLYQSKLRPTTPNKLPISQIFSRNFIQHNEYTFEPFSYGVEKAMPAFEYYRLQVKIGHFSLTANILCESCSNPLSNNQKISGKYGTAYFSKLNNKSICFKSTPYSSESFHQFFPRVIKEWSILKICSVIGCSLGVDPYLGFDVVVYADCIQYAMERGRPIQRLTRDYARILKYKLRTMHQLNIIHFDIKPENIVISQLGEPVFIDFGLSEIVKESCGFKTFCAFRGTPNYCSSEMKSMLGKEPSFVDVYYNDACGLEITIYLQSLVRLDESLDGIEQIECDDDGQTNLFYLFAFQFHYIHQNQLAAAQKLQKYISAKGNIKSILCFFKQMANYVFISSIFQIYLRKFSSLSDYREIQDEIRYSTKICFSKMHLFWSKTIQVEPCDDCKSDKKLKPYDSEKKQQLPLGEDPNRYMELLLNASESNLYSYQQYFQMAFSCIRFDVYNLSLLEKAAIAVKVNRYILHRRNIRMQQFQIKQKSNLGHVRMLIRLMLEECIKQQPTTKWAKGNIFDIFQQAIMVNIDTAPYIQGFICFISTHFYSPLDTALALLQLLRMNEAISMILAQNFESVQIVKTNLNSQIDALFEQFKSKQLIDPQLKMVRKIIDQYHNEDYFQHTRDYLKFKQNLAIVKNAKIKKYLLYFITVEQADNLFNSTNNDIIFQMIDEMRRMLSSLDFLSSIKITIKILWLTNRFGDIKAYSGQICKIVNCQEVYEHLNIDFGDLQNPTRTKYFLHNLQNFAKQYQKICCLNYKSYMHLRQFILEIYKGRNLDNEEVKKWLILIYPTFYEQFDSKSSNLDEQQVQSFWAATNLVEISCFYYRLSRQTQGLFLEQAQKIEQKLQQSLNDISALKKRPILFYQKNIFLLQIYYEQANYPGCLECLENIIMILKSLRLQRLILEFMKQHSMISKIINDEKSIIHSSMQLLDFCLHGYINFSSFYLQSVNFEDTFTLFLVLARNQPSKLRQLLITFIDFLNQHPVQNYFANLFTIIAHFLKKDPSFGYVIHIKSFRIDNIIHPINPYVLIFVAISLKSEDKESQKLLLKPIAINIDRVICFVKKIILRQYFIIFMDLMQGKCLRQQMGIFRMAKVYLSSKERKIICRQLFKHKIRRIREKSQVKSKIAKNLDMM